MLEFIPIGNENEEETFPANIREDSILKFFCRLERR